MKIFLLLLLFTAGALAQEDCPNEASECPDICGGNSEAAKCARFINAECRMNPCHGLCTPNFFWKGRNMTDRCAVERCTDKVCQGRRQCVEETVPPSCPEGRPQCRQFIRARCMLLPTPTNCSELTCRPGMYCRQKKRGEGVMCVRARNCDQLTCSDGLACTETDNGPKCVDITVEPATTPTMLTITTPFPGFCSSCELFGQVCEIVNGSYECVVPSECTPARTEFCLYTNGQLCEERDGAAECVFAKSCDEITCPRGYECQDFGPSVMIAFCSQLTVAETCDELDCERTPNQVCEQRNDSAVCVPGCNERDQELCEIQGGKCEVIDGFPQCVTPSTCDEVECDPGELCLVTDSFSNDTQSIAICVPGLSGICEESTCPSGQACYQQAIPSRNFSIAQCVPEEAVESLPTVDNFKCTTATEPLCLESQICSELYENGQFLSFVCNNYTTDCSDNTDCEPDQRCTDVPSFIVPGFRSICLPTDENIFQLSIGRDCSLSARECPEGLVCQDISYDGITIGTSCGVSIPYVLGNSCAELVCPESFECVEGILLDGGGLAQCTNEEGINNVLQSLIIG